MAGGEQSRDGNKKGKTGIGASDSPRGSAHKLEAENEKSKSP